MASKPIGPLPPTLRELSYNESLRDKARLVAAYPRPVVVLPPFPDGKSSDPDNETQELGPAGVFSTARSQAGFKTFFDVDDGEESSKARTGRNQIRSGEGFVWPLAKSGRNSFAEMITVGRATNNDIVIPSGTVSKLHGYFMQAPDGKWRFCDTGSMNGVWLRGKRVPARTTVDLADDDEILLGPDVPALFKTPEGLFELISKLKSLP